MNINRRQFHNTVAAGAAGALGVLRSKTTELCGSGLGLPIERTFPPLEGAVEWLNSKPLTKTDLRGKVILINFWTYTCINSLRTLPYLRAWAEKYGRQGLVVIGVHTPEFIFEYDVGNVRRAVKKIQVNYPIAIDSSYAIWHAFENQYWPAVYLADEDGQIRHSQFGEGEYERTESAIQTLLRKSSEDNGSQEFVPVNGRGIEAVPAWASLQSPESYLGADLAQHFASQLRRHSYVAPSRLQLNQWALEGNWKIGKQAVILKEANGRIVYRFHSRDLHLVMAPPASASVRFRVSMDGQAPGLSHGLDVDREGYGTLAEPRLHQLIRQANSIADRQFEIEFLAPGAEAFDFTFG